MSELMKYIKLVVKITEERDTLRTLLARCEKPLCLLETYQKALYCIPTDVSAALRKDIKKALK